MVNTTGIEALLEIFKHEGVEYIFGIPGATEVHFIDALEDYPEIQYRLCLHELTAVGIAEGYSRTSRKVGVLNLHTGTGLAAALPLLSNAHYGGVPLLVTVGQQDTRLIASEPHMSDDLVKIASPFTKWSTQVMHAEDIPMVIRRAFKVATHPPTGPVMVALPSDVLTNSFDFEYRDSCHSFTKLHPDDNAIKVASNLLKEARNPAILVEDGVTKCEALSEVVQFAELIGARVYQPWMADVNFPVHHPQYIGDLDVTDPKTRGLFESVDVLVVIGTSFLPQPFYLPDSLIPPDMKVIQVDDNPWQIAKNYAIDCNVEGDIKVAVSDMFTALINKMTPQGHKRVKARIEQISIEKQTIVNAFEDKARQEKDNVPISGTRLMQEIRDAIKPGSLIVDDCWSYSSVLRRTLNLSEPGSYQRSRAGGSIGGGLSCAIGAKLASPDRPVICVSGDGSAMWGIQSLWVAARYQIPVVFIVIANGVYRQVRMMKSKMLGLTDTDRNLGTTLSPPQIDFCRIAEGMGLFAQKVEKPEEIRVALDIALNSNQACLIEVSAEAGF